MASEHIFQAAVGLTKVYAEGLQQGRQTATGRVYVLLMGDHVMGVLSTYTSAHAEAEALVDAHPPDSHLVQWEHRPGSDMWLCGLRCIRISTHDVR